MKRNGRKDDKINLVQGADDMGFIRNTREKNATFFYFDIGIIFFFFSSFSFLFFGQYAFFILTPSRLSKN